MASSGDQVVLHLNSHGPKTRAPNESSANNSFTALTTMPITDINKIGILSAKIPRAMDILDKTNNKIILNLELDTGVVVSYLATLPLLDYYPGNGAQGNVVDTLLQVVAQQQANPLNLGPPTVVSSLENTQTDAINLSEVLQYSFNHAVRINGPNNFMLYQDNYAVIVTNVGRLVVAVGARFAGGKHADRITGCTLQMSKQLCFSLGFPMMEQHSFARKFRPQQQLTDNNNPLVRYSPNINQAQNPGAGDPPSNTEVPYVYGQNEADVQNQLNANYPNLDNNSAILKRGNISLGWVTGIVGETNMLVFCAPRPVNMRGPSTILVQLHTTGTKSRALGFDSEKACWALSVDNSQWVSNHANNSIRDCEADPGGIPVSAPSLPLTRAAGLQTYYPYGLKYFNSWQQKPDPTDGWSSIFDWSFVTPQWQFCKTERVTVQDLQWSLYSGDTHMPLKIYSGCPTEFTLIASP